MHDRIICGDTDELLPQLINVGVKVDLILTDVPYNIGVHFGQKKDSEKIDALIEQNNYRYEMYKSILNDTGSLIMFVSNAFLHVFLTCGVISGLNYKMQMVWVHKNSGKAPKQTPKIVTDPILWFTKGNTWAYNIDDVRVPYLYPDRAKYGDRKRLKDGTIKHYSPSPLGACHTNVWEYPSLTGRTFAKERVGHPTQKPENLIRDLIKAFCPKDTNGRYNGIVFDPFLGSGTTGAVCEKLNKHEGHHIEWFGIEYDRKWCEVAEDRINKIGEIQE